MKKWIKYSLIAGAMVLSLAGLMAADYFGWLPQKTYSAADFGIETVKSRVDFNENGIDDSTDLVRGARLDAQNRPRYNGAYWPQGYPPDDVGVCTDLVWRAFAGAGYSLRQMIDADIAARPEAYPHITTPDSNIDFRRVVNLRIFFEEYGICLTTDTSEIVTWQPGDLVVFKNDKHIGVVSDQRNEHGQPFILHNSGQYKREEDYLPGARVSAHFRFDGATLPAWLQIPYEGAQ